MTDRLYRKARNKTGRGLEKFLGELELAAMDIVWERESVTVADVLESLNQEDNRQLAYTTVMTIMSRLADKGWLTAEKRGRAYAYRATYTRSEAEVAAVSSGVRSLVEDFGEVAIAQFVKELDDVDPKQLTRLAALADDTEEKDENHDSQ